MRREWVSYLDSLSEEDELVAFLDVSNEEDWVKFRRNRPVTAHLLEELFGKTQARTHVKDLDSDFTESKAVRMVSYVYNSPKKVIKPDKFQRTRQFLTIKSKE
jgi:hypothetical protein